MADSNAEVVTVWAATFDVPGSNPEFYDRCGAALSGLADIGLSVAGGADVGHSQVADRLWVDGGESEADGAAPVVAGERVPVKPEVLSRAVRRRRRDRSLVVAAGWTGGVAQPAEVGGDDPVLRLHSGDYMAPAVPALWAAVQQNHGLVPGAGGDLVHLDGAWRRDWISLNNELLLRMYAA